ncbi:MAG: hypothetical protein ACP5HC_06180 [Caldisericum sp.]
MMLVKKIFSKITSLLGKNILPDNQNNQNNQNEQLKLLEKLTLLDPLEIINAFDAWYIEGDVLPDGCWKKPDLISKCKVVEIKKKDEPWINIIVYIYDIAKMRTFGENGYVCGEFEEKGKKKWYEYFPIYWERGDNWENVYEKRVKKSINLLTL